MNAFDCGYSAFMKGEPCDPSQSQEWQNGWQHAAALKEEALTQE